MRLCLREKRPNRAPVSTLERIRLDGHALDPCVTAAKSIFRTERHTEREKARPAGGGGGIRTPETLSGLTVFKTAAFNRSATPPFLILTYSAT
jgi:hypothetical protein